MKLVTRIVSSDEHIFEILEAHEGKQFKSLEITTIRDEAEVPHFGET